MLISYLIFNNFHLSSLVSQMVESVRALRLQLVELERVSQLCGEYIVRYTGQLRERLLSHGELFERTTGLANFATGASASAFSASALDGGVEESVLGSDRVAGEGGAARSTKAERARVWLLNVGRGEWSSAGKEKLERRGSRSSLLWTTDELSKSPSKKVCSSAVRVYCTVCIFCTSICGIIFGTFGAIDESSRVEFR